MDSALIGTLGVIILVVVIAAGAYALARRSARPRPKAAPRPAIPTEQKARPAQPQAAPRPDHAPTPRRPTAPPASPAGAADPEEQLHKALLRKVRGNRETAERLIQFEARKAPGASRSTLMRNAIERWEQDNR
ncbi:hypothetical protein EKD04_003915 [Chloroflexales bacterium ZM16-3]|nr:hypothetical protein [Chloroflexales bacterium ZM16-3]